MKKNLFVLSTLVAIAVAILLPKLLKTERASLPRTSKYTHRATFKLANVKPATDTLETMDCRELLTEWFVTNVTMAAKNQYINESGDTNFVPPIRRIECFSRDRRPLVPASTNGFLYAVYRAYAEHRPLVLSPDMVWLTILQGFSTHVNLNAEALRHHFVQYKGKKVIEVKLDRHVTLGSDDSDWEWVFAQFQKQIGEKTNPELAELAAGRFSGTNTDAGVAFDITLMAATRQYFDFWGSVMCGIPEITLEGTPDDWAQIEQRAAQLSKYELDWWLKDLQPILAQFTRAARGDVDRAFWLNMVKIYEEDLVCATEEHPTGWILAFFPYIKDLEKENAWMRNPMIALLDTQLFAVLPKDAPSDGTRGDYFCDNGNSFRIKYIGPVIRFACLPEGVLECMLNIDNNGDLMKMELKTGFFGIRQDLQTMAIRPEIGWAIVDTGEKPDAVTTERYEKHKTETLGN